MGEAAWLHQTKASLAICHWTSWKYDQATWVFCFAAETPQKRCCTADTKVGHVLCRYLYLLLRDRKSWLTHARMHTSVKWSSSTLGICSSAKWQKCGSVPPPHPLCCQHFSLESHLMFTNIACKELLTWPGLCKHDGRVVKFATDVLTWPIKWPSK